MESDEDKQASDETSWSSILKNPLIKFPNIIPSMHQKDHYERKRILKEAEVETNAQHISYFLRREMKKMNDSLAKDDPFFYFLITVIF